MVEETQPDAGVPTPPEPPEYEFDGDTSCSHQGYLPDVHGKKCPICGAVVQQH